VDKRTYFIKAINAGAYRWTNWVIDAFGIPELRESPTQDDPLHPEQHWPYQLYSKDGKERYFVDPKTGEETLLVGPPLNEPLYLRLEEVVFSAGDFANVSSELVTTYGNGLYNAFALLYAFGSRVPFQVGRVDIPKLEQYLVSKYVESNPADDQIDTGMLEKYLEGSLHMEGFAQLFAPSGTRRSFLPHPDGHRLRDELLEKHKDELHDPVVLANIAKQLSDLDRQWIAEDPDGGFIRSAKDFDVTRAKMYYMYGMEYNFNGDGGIQVIPRSLSEGYDIKKLPPMINSMRDASHSRGAMTALGGTVAKDTLRMTSNLQVKLEDCGTQLGEWVVFTPENKNEFAGKYLIVSGGKSRLLDKVSVGELVGKRAMVRSTQTCKAKAPDYCIYCMGEFIRGRETAVSIAETQVGNQLMLLQMKKMHGKALSAVEFDLSVELT
jgi:hypothetical protein